MNPLDGESYLPVDVTKCSSDVFEDVPLVDTFLVEELLEFLCDLSHDTTADLINQMKLQSAIVIVDISGRWKKKE